MTQPRQDPGFDQRVARAHEARDELRGALGREPSTHEVAERLGADEGAVEEMLARTPTTAEDYSGRPVAGREDGR
jgi:DNA-directed RNA polymerase specialized sigma subunit